MQEALLGNPALFLYQHAVHDGNLPGRTTKTDEAEFEPELQGLKK
jgi:hypothetical protein